MTILTQKELQQKVAFWYERYEKLSNQVEELQSESQKFTKLIEDLRWQVESLSFNILSLKKEE